MRELGWSERERSVFDPMISVDPETPPTAEEVSACIPRTISVNPIEYKTQRLIMEIRQDQVGNWSIGYRRTSLTKSSRTVGYVLKQFSWSSKRLVDTLAECWIALKERGLLIC